jgi:hypothetical protein
LHAVHVVLGYSLLYLFFQHRLSLYQSILHVLIDGEDLLFEARLYLVRDVTKTEFYVQKTTNIRADKFLSKVCSSIYNIQFRGLIRKFTLVIKYSWERRHFPIKADISFFSFVLLCIVIHVK